jgi:hypothetical protein
MFLNILATFAEFEVDLLRMRTREGMAVARAKGRLRGKAQAVRQATDRTAAHARHRHYSIADLAELSASAEPTPGTGTSALRRQWLAEPQVVAAGVADGGVTDAVGLVDGLLEDLRPGGAQRLEGLV